ncbi:ankyrin repeat domain-containing protein [Clostridiaceae bacterium HSG29]|nr:ankyrin repeat domain-containing protein [Clostridiaceae bacterium HSG29]
MNIVYILLAIAVLVFGGSYIYMRNLKEKIKNGRNDMREFFYSAIENGTLNEMDEMGHTPLMIAIKGKFNKSALKIIDAGADVNVKGETGEQAIHLAAHHSPMVVIERLIEKGADINSVDMQGCTPLWYAAQNRRDDMVSLLIKSNADINAIDTQFGLSPLMIAAQNGAYKIVDILLENKADKLITATDFGTAYDIAKLRLNGNIKENKKAVNELERMVEILKIEE